MEVENEVELEEYNIIIKIPKVAADLTVTVNYIEDGKVVTAIKHLSVADIHEARQAFLDNVELGDDYDARYVLTEEGKQLAEKLRAQEALTDPDD